MAAGHGSKAKVYLDGYDISSYLTSVSTPLTVDTAETQGFGATSKTYVIGLDDTQLTFEGVWDGATSAIDAIINGVFQAAAQKIALYFPNNDSVGNRAECIQADQSAYDPSSSLTDASKFTGTLQASTGLESGVSLHALGAETVAGSGASVDNGAATTNGGSGYVLATAATGAATLKVQHSTDNITFPDLITFAAVTGRTAERKTVTGTVNRYLRSNYAPGTTVTFAMAFSRKAP